MTNMRYFPKALRTSLSLCSLLPLTALVIALPPFAREMCAAPQGASPTLTDSQNQPAARTGLIEFRMRDFETGYSVPATVSYADLEAGWVNPLTVSTDEYGGVRLELAPATYLFEITAPGFKRLRMYLIIVPGKTQASKVMLSPETPPQELLPNVLNPKLRPGYTLVSGYVVDSITGKPLDNVQVLVRNAGAEARTNERGYYEVSVPSPPPVELEGVQLSGGDDLTFSLPGYKKYLARNLDFPDGQTAGLNLPMERGAGETEEDYTHKLKRQGKPGQAPQSAGREFDSPAIDPRILRWLSEKPGKGLTLGTGTGLETASPVAIAVPDTILVGSQCVSPYNCITSTPYPLEDYVRQGLEDEWNSGWDTNALKAGAVA